MTRDEFSALPAALQVQVLLDCLEHVPHFPARFAAAPTPRVEFPPKYDARIRRAGGICWASECDLEGVNYWLKRAEEGAASGSEFAEKDRKQAVALAKFRAWREQNPGVQWTGVRGDETVTAAPPSSRPTVYPVASRRNDPPPPAERPQGSGDYDGTYGEPGTGDDNVPFAYCVTDEPTERWWPWP